VKSRRLATRKTRRRTNFMIVTKTRTLTVFAHRHNALPRSEPVDAR
jgi:hypothetical protein